MSKVFSYLKAWDLFVLLTVEQTKFFLARTRLRVKILEKRFWYWLLRKEPKILMFQNIDIPLSDAQTAIWVEVKNATHIAVNGIKYSSSKNIIILSQDDRSKSATIVAYGYKRNVFKTIEINKTTLKHHIPQIDYAKSFNPLEFTRGLSFELTFNQHQLQLPESKLELNNVSIQRTSVLTAFPHCNIDNNTNLFYQIYEQQRKKKNL